MITLSTAAQSVLTRSFRRYLAVESWRDGQLLAAEIPVDSASEETDRTLRIPERVVFRIPRRDRGTSWAPNSDDHPLAANGQTLRVKLGIGLSLDTVEWFQRGVFLIYDSANEGDAVRVTAVGLLRLIDEARLISPYQPTGTLVSTLRGLLEPALTVSIDAAVLDRSVPSGINYDEDRLGAMLELLDAWPADAYVDPTGAVQVISAAQDTTPVLALTSGTGGTVISAVAGSTREGAFNVVVARGTAADGGQVQGVAYDYSGGPKTYGGPFSPLPVPYYYASPLLTNVGQCSDAAQTVLARLRRNAAREFQVEMVPHPGLQVRDVVSITTDEVTALPCSVEALSLPYLAGSDAQTLTLRSLA